MEKNMTLFIVATIAFVGGMALAAAAGETWRAKDHAQWCEWSCEENTYRYEVLEGKCFCKDDEGHYTPHGPVEKNK